MADRPKPDHDHDQNPHLHDQIRRLQQLTILPPTIEEQQLAQDRIRNARLAEIARHLQGIRVFLGLLVFVLAVSGLVLLP